MILKVLAIGVVLFLVYIILFKKDREKSVKKDRKDKNEEIMVECPRCSTFVSKEEAILSNGRYFCSKECLLNK